MKFIKEFKEFAVRGNVMDMTVGVIIGGGFRQDRHLPHRRRPHAALGLLVGERGFPNPEDSTPEGVRRRPGGDARKLRGVP